MESLRISSTKLGGYQAPIALLKHHTRPPERLVSHRLDS